MNVPALLAGFFSGVIGAMGLGGGAVLIIYLSVFTETEQLAAQGINLLFFLPIGLLAVTVYAIKKQIQWRVTLKIAAFGLLGAAAGLCLTSTIGGGLTGKLFGGLLVVLGLDSVFRPAGKKEKSPAGQQKGKKK